MRAYPVMSSFVPKQRGGNILGGSSVAQQQTSSTSKTTSPLSSFVTTAEAVPLVFPTAQNNATSTSARRLPAHTENNASQQTAPIEEVAKRQPQHAEQVQKAKQPASAGDAFVPLRHWINTSYSMSSIGSVLIYNAITAVKGTVVAPFAILQCIVSWLALQCLIYAPFAGRPVENIHSSILFIVTSASLSASIVTIILSILFRHLTPLILAALLLVVSLYMLLRGGSGKSFPIAVAVINCIGLVVQSDTHSALLTWLLILSDTVVIVLSWSYLIGESALTASPVYAPLTSQAIDGIQKSQMAHIISSRYSAWQLDDGFAKERISFVTPATATWSTVDVEASSKTTFLSDRLALKGIFQMASFVYTTSDIRLFCASLIIIIRTCSQFYQLACANASAKNPATSFEMKHAFDHQANQRFLRATPGSIKA